ncbi:uncharacterized protein LOC134812207 isoform X1 [Bolinopsis microptera]|uniref:uncharacterized protein LOC134812207 isoform X1 n=1 Tax=Bolinopsis microptera TaxID=2820187 RepID=UPI00307A9C25
MAGYSPYQEDRVLVHRALLNCLRRSNSPEDRRSYLCIMENIVAQKTGVPVFTPFFNLLQSSADEITRNLSYEIQQIKMEDQVELLVLENTPPDEEGAMGNMIRDEEPINIVVQNGRSSSESSGEDDDFIDLSELIMNDSINIVNPKNVPEAGLTGFGVTTPTDISSTKQPLEIFQTGIPAVPPPSADILSPMMTLSFNSNNNINTNPPLDHIPAPIPAVSRPTNIPSPMAVSRPPMAVIIPDNVMINNTLPLIENIPIVIPALSRLPSSTMPVSRPPMAAPDDVFVDSPIISPATRVPGEANMDICNSVPQIPITMVRPKGFLPFSTTSIPDTELPSIPNTSDYETVALRNTQSTSSERRLPRHESSEPRLNRHDSLDPRLFRHDSSDSRSSRHDSSEPKLSRHNSSDPRLSLHDSSDPRLSRHNSSEPFLSRQSTVSSSVFSRQNSDYVTKPLPRAGAISSDYSSGASRQNSTEQVRESSRSSSSEGATITQPETHKGSTVYRSKRITHLQLMAFLENTTLKAELKELGAFYMISACEEPKYYNISLSGDRATTSKAVEMFASSLLPDNSEYITEEVPIPVYQELKESGYLLQLLRQLYPGIDIKVERPDSEQLTYHLSGNNNHVFEVVSLIKFMTSLPDKKFGMLLKLHNRLTNSPELIDRLINSAQNITKTPVMCLDCTKTEACKFLFVPGLCGTENQYKLQKHLNVLVEKFEQAENNEMPTPSPMIELDEDPLGKTLVKYTFEEMLIIRDKCTEPHIGLLEQKSLPIKLITKIDNT